MGMCTNCMDCPRTSTMLWVAMSLGFRRRMKARVRWKSERLRIIVFADIIAMAAVVVVAGVLGCSRNSRFWVKRIAMHVDVACCLGPTMI